MALIYSFGRVTQFYQNPIINVSTKIKKRVFLKLHIFKEELFINIL